MKMIYWKLIALVLLLNFVVWLPFLLKTSIPGWSMDFTEGTKILWQNYDGPNYLIIAKTWYNTEKIRLEFSNPLPVEYYPAHFPLYPAVIWVFDTVVKGPTAMLLATLLGTILSVLMFYKYVSEFKLSKNPFLLCLVFMIFPFRVLALRAVGSPEPWFILFVLASIYNFRKEKFFVSSIFAGLAVLTKSPGILLPVAYALYWLRDLIEKKKNNWNMLWIKLPGLFVLGLFCLYKIQTGDFWAYFNSGDNIHLFWPPFSIFAPQGQFWVGNFWLEDVLWIWLFFGLGVVRLWNKRLRIESVFAGLFFVSTLFVAHRDISRYILPISPLVLIAMDDLLQRKEFKFVIALLILPTLLFTWNFLLHNTAPIADWAPYL